MQKKKSLGQHFLRSPHYVGLIADALDITKGETVLEIGPGDGALTAALLARGAHVIAVEKDARLVPLLQDRFKDFDISRFRVVEGDALDFDISKFQNLKISKYKVAGNIPYYITGALFKKYLTLAHQPSTLVFLVQKEVAQRVIGHPSTRSGSPKESILSLSVKAYGTPLYIKSVPRGAFAPPPKVDSAIIKVSGISRAKFKNTAHERRFFEVVRAGFAQKRKMLKSNLKKLLKERAEALGSARAEDVKLEQWLELASRF